MASIESSGSPVLRLVAGFALAGARLTAFEVVADPTGKPMDQRGALVQIQ